MDSEARQIFIALADDDGTGDPPYSNSNFAPLASNRIISSRRGGMGSDDLDVNFTVPATQPAVDLTEMVFNLESGEDIYFDYDQSTGIFTVLAETLTITDGNLNFGANDFRIRNITGNDVEGRLRLGVYNIDEDHYYWYARGTRVETIPANSTLTNLQMQNLPNLDAAFTRGQRGQFMLRYTYPSTYHDPDLRLNPIPEADDFEIYSDNGSAITVDFDWDYDYNTLQHLDIGLGIADNGDVESFDIAGNTYPIVSNTGEPLGEVKRADEDNVHRRFWLYKGYNNRSSIPPNISGGSYTFDANQGRYIFVGPDFSWKTVRDDPELLNFRYIAVAQADAYRSGRIDFDCS